ncbi:MAG: hypothetical protein RBT69_01040 [Spirochaetia bacterium]|jgi:hypothetical protein|nr:hypothetical protein [Spirochaetia bacterium]
MNIASLIINIISFLFFLAAGAVVVFSQNFASASDAGTGLTVFFAENLTLIVIISLIFYIPSFWAKSKKHLFLTALISTAALSLFLAAAGIFSPYTDIVFSRPDVDAGRFYQSERKLLFVDSIENGKLTGVIINKKDTSNPAAPASDPAVYSGNYTVKENMKLRLSSESGEYKLGTENPLNRFFNSLIKYSSFISADISRGSLSSIYKKAVKTISVIISISAISIFFSSGSWPLINYMLSQFFIFIFIWLNFHLHRIPVPSAPGSMPALFSDKTLTWYLSYILLIAIITAVFWIKRLTGVPLK